MDQDSYTLGLNINNGQMIQDELTPSCISLYVFYMNRAKLELSEAIPYPI